MNTEISQVNIELSGNLYSDKTNYEKLFKAYSLWASMNLIQKHSTHDSIFFIFKETEGFKVVKFYNGDIDYRVSGHLETLSEAYNEGCQGL